MSQKQRRRRQKQRRHQPARPHGGTAARSRRRIVATAGLAAGATLAGSGGVAQAADFTVSSLSDSGAGSLRQAVLDANAAAGADRVQFEAGLTGTIPLSGGEIPITDEVEILGPGAEAITVDAEGSSRIFNAGLADTGDRLGISGLTLTGGATLGSVPDDGGAIYSDLGRLTIADTVITGNTSASDGGGVFVNVGALRLEDTTVSDNNAASTGGGAEVEDGAVRVIDSTFSGNEAIGSRGGGLYSNNNNGDKLTIVRGSTFTENIANSDGGGLYLDDGPLDVIDSTFDGNVTDDHGGGLYTDAEDTLTVIRNSTLTDNVAGFDGSGDGGGFYANGGARIVGVTITGNSAAEDGGGVYTSGGYSQLEIVNSTLSDNTAGNDGGAVYADDGTVELVNSTVDGNTATADGGGIYAEDSLFVSNSTISGNAALNGGGAYVAADYSAVIRSSTITDNSATADGGGIYFDSSYYSADRVGNLHNTIVAGNTAGGLGPDLYGDWEGSFVLVGDDSDATLAEDVPGSNIIGADPQLGPLADNGGPTRTHALPKSSPAVDQGSSAEEGFPTDQRWLTRPADFADVANSGAARADGTDIGSFELQLPVSPPPPGDTTAPVLTLDAKAKQRAKTRVRVFVSCDEPCTVVAEPKLKTAVKKRTRKGKRRDSFLLPAAEAETGSGGVQLPVKLTKTARRSAKKSLKRGGKANVKLRLEATDAAGNTSTDNAKVKLKLKKKK